MEKAAPELLPGAEQTSTTSSHHKRRHLIGRLQPRWKLTVLGRCVALSVGEVLANLILWAAALALFAPDPRTRGVLSLALIAWTLGLRHGLDMDHIVAIDNVTRNLVSMGQLPVTCGLFFSLGHSSIVVGATIAIIVAVSAIEKIPDVGEVGGLIGVSVSASFLFILAVINSIVLYHAIKTQKARKAVAQATALAPTKEVPDDELAIEKPDGDEERGEETRKDEIVPGLPATTCLARIGRPIFRIIDRPWKMYPVGVLFGFGFDTASEITLLGVSALARSGSYQLPRAQIIVLPLLFAAGMTLVDSLDSIFMLHAYALPGRPEGAKSWWSGLRLFERTDEAEGVEALEGETRGNTLPMVNQDKLLTVSVVLTVLSITVALLISITEFMGLALEKCGPCSEAAENDPGVSGRWWRFWAAVNDNSGYLGAGVVGLFIAVFGAWALHHQVQKRRKAKSGQQTGTAGEP